MSTEKDHEVPEKHVWVIDFYLHGMFEKDPPTERTVWFIGLLGVNASATARVFSSLCMIK